MGVAIFSETVPYIINVRVYITKKIEGYLTGMLAQWDVSCTGYTIDMCNHLTGLFWPPSIQKTILIWIEQKRASNTTA